MTVMNLLKPGVFKINKEDMDRRKTLLKGLFPQWDGFNDEQKQATKSPHREGQIISLESERRIRKSIGISQSVRKDKFISHCCRN